MRVLIRLLLHILLRFSVKKLSELCLRLGHQLLLYLLAVEVHIFEEFVQIRSDLDGELQVIEEEPVALAGSYDDFLADLLQRDLAHRLVSELDILCLRLQHS